MSTDITEVEGQCVLASIQYLERNDFTSISKVSRHILQAKDGARHVIVWLCFDKLITVPAAIMQVAREQKARLDVLSMNVEGEQAYMKHIMNVDPA